MPPRGMLQLRDPFGTSGYLGIQIVVESRPKLPKDQIKARRYLLG